MEAWRCAFPCGKANQCFYLYGLGVAGHGAMLQKEGRQEAEALGSLGVRGRHEELVLTVTCALD